MYKEAYEVLSKGIIVSLNSQKYLKISNFLNIDDNFEEFDDILEKIGYRLVGENGYFYIVKISKLERSEVESFVNTHKKTIVSISILKQIFPLISVGDTIKQTLFTNEITKKDDELIFEKFNFLFGKLDLKSYIEEFFKLLEKSFVIEKISSKNKDSYRVLNALSYYIKLVESAF